ncbi:hypothetical protein ACE6H2_019378 [Prunus campanulata]
MQQVIYDLSFPKNPNPSVAIRHCGFMFTSIRCLSGFGYGISFRFEPLKCLKFVKSPLSTASSTHFLLEDGIFPKLAFIEILFSGPNFQNPFAASGSIVQLTMAGDGCTVKDSHYFHLSEEAMLLSAIYK